MKNLIYILTLLCSLVISAQNLTSKGRFRIELRTLEKSNNDIISHSIVEVFSINKRIATSISNFDGISILYLNSVDVINDVVRLKVHAPKCKIFEMNYTITNDSKIKIPLEYGKTDYQNHNQTMEMYKKLKISPSYLGDVCGFEDLPVLERVKVKN